MQSQTLRGSQEKIFSVPQNSLQASWGTHGANLVSVPICAGVWERPRLVLPGGWSSLAGLQAVLLEVLTVMGASASCASGALICGNNGP